MRRAPSASGLSRLLPTPRSPALPDAAEMGTAYGLEMTLEAHRSSADAAASVSSTKAQRAIKAPAASKGWLTRLKRAR